MDFFGSVDFNFVRKPSTGYKRGTRRPYHFQREQRGPEKAGLFSYIFPYIGIQKYLSNKNKYLNNFFHTSIFLYTNKANKAI